MAIQVQDRVGWLSVWLLIHVGCLPCGLLTMWAAYHVGCLPYGLLIYEYVCCLPMSRQQPLCSQPRFTSWNARVSPTSCKSSVARLAYLFPSPSEQPPSPPRNASLSANRKLVYLVLGIFDSICLPESMVSKRSLCFDALLQEEGISKRHGEFAYVCALRNRTLAHRINAAKFCLFEDAYRTLDFPA